MDKETFETIVSKYVQQVGDKRRYRRNEVEDLTCECLREIISIEPSLGPAPSPNENLWTWELRVPTSPARNLTPEIKRRLREREQELQEEKRARDAAQGQQLIDKYADLIRACFKNTS